MGAASLWLLDSQEWKLASCFPNYLGEQLFGLNMEMSLWKYLIFSEYVKKQLGPLDTHLMSTVLWKQCWRNGAMRPVFEGRRWKAGFAPWEENVKAGIRGTSSSASVGFQVNIRNS